MTRLDVTHPTAQDLYAFFYHPLNTFYLGLPSEQPKKGIPSITMEGNRVWIFYNNFLFSTKELIPDIPQRIAFTLQKGTLKIISDQIVETVLVSQNSAILKPKKYENVQVYMSSSEENKALDSRVQLSHLKISDIAPPSGNNQF